MNEQPPTDVPSAHVGGIPRPQAISVRLAPAHATPSMSEGFRPVSFIARMADSEWRPSCDSSGKTPPALTISAAPTIATLPGFTTSGSLRGPPERQCDFVVDFVRGDLERHIE